MYFKVSIIIKKYLFFFNIIYCHGVLNTFLTNDLFFFHREFYLLWALRDPEMLDIFGHLWSVVMRYVYVVLPQNNN